MQKDQRLLDLAALLLKAAEPVSWREIQEQFPDDYGGSGEAAIRKFERDKADLLERTAQSMQFPAWFGHNWDAWFDCLADLGWHDRAPGYVVILRHAEGLRRAVPEAFDTALSILEDVARVWVTRGVAFRAFIDCD